MNDRHIACLYTVHIIAEVPPEAPTVYLTGNLPVLGPWDPGLVPMAGAGRERTLTLSVPAGHRLEYKISLGSWDREGLGPSGTVMPNVTVEVDGDCTVRSVIVDFKKDPLGFIHDPSGSGVIGELIYWLDVPSAHLDRPRHVSIWLPPDYTPTRRYPVLYMADGQNLFDPRIANTGTDWGVDEAMVAGDFEPAVVVGVWSTADRIAEYSPWMRGPRYARFLIEELMPRIAAAFSVRTGPESTFHMGSSMGGLISLYLVQTFPAVFSAAGCLSTHVVHPERPGVRPHLLAAIEAGATMPAGQRLRLDYGSEGLDAIYAEPHAVVRQWLLDQGLTEGRDFEVIEVAGAAHNEAAWRARAGEHLRFLLG